VARAVLHLSSHSTRSQQPFHRGHAVHRYDSNPAGQHLGYVREHTDSDIILSCGCNDDNDTPSLFPPRHGTMCHCHHHDSWPPSSSPVSLLSYDTSCSSIRILVHNT
ncbi:hypothetical protein EV363DRAFT_1179655, partial [Boletus edulis]